MMSAPTADMLGFDPAMVEHINDVRPIAVRRKRRASSVNPLNRPEQPDTSDEHAIEVNLLESSPRTPARQKRVRFSFPPDTSTGLTQHIARTHLINDTDAPAAPNARLLAQKPRRPRRAVSDGPRELAVLSSNNIEVQFKPIRQILSERTKRQLSRNHMSEAINDIETEHKSRNALSRELIYVKHELHELTAGSVAAMQGTARIRGLEAEVETLKRQLQERSQIAAEDSPIAELDAVDMIESDDPSLFEADTDSSCISRDEFSSQPATPTTPVSMLDASSITEASSPLHSKDMQTELTKANLDQIQEHLQMQAEHLKRARLDLERLLPGETSLPLASPTKRLHSAPRSPLAELGGHEQSGPLGVPLVDAQPLIAALFTHLNGMSQRATRAAQALAAAEDQKANLKGHFRAALRQLDETRAAYAIVIAESQRRAPATPATSPGTSEAGSPGSDKENSDPQSQSEEQEQMFEEAQRRIEKLEADAAAYDQDRAALIAALEKYRKEVKDLESLVTNMESEHVSTIRQLKSEHSSALSELMGEHAQAIEDLELQVDAEAKDRREAEAEIDAIMGRWGAQRERSDRDMGRLNVQIAKLTDQVKDKEKMVEDLHQHSLDMRERVGRFLSSMGGQLSWEDLEAGHFEATQPDLPQHKASRRTHTAPPTTKSLGLLTPSMEGGRFRDAMQSPVSPNLSSELGDASASVPGAVEIGRGKRRSRRVQKSSGIGMVAEEDEEQ